MLKHQHLKTSGLQFGIQVPERQYFFFHAVLNIGINYLAILRHLEQR